MDQPLREARMPLSDLASLNATVARVFQNRCATAMQSYVEASGQAIKNWIEAAGSPSAAELRDDLTSYWGDFPQRSILFWDTLRQRGNNWLEHEKAGKPPLLAFDWEMVCDGRKLERPVNYALVQIVPPPGVKVDRDKRPFVIIDPRAGHGPGIGGFKKDSQVGVALKAGHPVYFVIFFPEPVEGQTLADVSRAETDFLRIVRERHPTRGKPVIIGNCQGGWAAMLVGALDPDCVGPIVVNGAPMSYWAGNDAENPMRYAGGMLGGSWPVLMACDLGGGQFDGAYLVDNFEYLNPANTYFQKLYHLFANVDTEPPRYLEFERWWGGYFLMNREEIEWIVDNLFVGNKLASGHAEWSPGNAFDLRAIRSPIILFASLGDNITPPQQAFNWVADLYPTTKELKANGQVIVGLMHEKIGHLGIFVSGAIAKREHAQIVNLLEYVEHLPPGLYGMKVEEERADGKAAYNVTITERRVEDLQQLQKYSRRDEIPFSAVAEVSRRNASLYETFAHPALSTLVPRSTASVARTFHPQRIRRWAISDLNPWMAAVERLASAVKSNRMPRDEHGLSSVTEHWLASSIGAWWDLYRQLRDAAVENLFFNIYGAMSVLAPVAETPAPELQREAMAPAISDALAHISEGGFTDAAVRAALLVGRQGNRQRSLATMEQMRKLVGKEFGLLDLPADEARAIIQRQSHIVDHDPERAMDTLPTLLKTTEERQRIVDLLEKLAQKLELSPAQGAVVPEFRRRLFSEQLGEVRQ